MGQLFEIGIVAALLGVGLFAGGYAERRHFRRLAEREAANGSFFVSQLRSYSNATAGAAPPMMIVGEAVIATDYMKSFRARLRKIFGGELKSYQSLLIRGRREALQRVIEQARSDGYNAICNVRFDSADVGGNSKARRVAMVAIIASATAYHRATSPS